MIANLNVLCKVQLNDLGKKIWLSQIENLPQEVLQNRPDIVTNIQNKIDENNCIELELWAVMNIFGAYMSPVNSPFTRTTIELKQNPNLGNYS